MAESYHITHSIEYLLQLPDDELAGLIHKGGAALSAPSAREELRDLQARGFEVVPACEHYDDRGHCQGHDPIRELGDWLDAFLVKDGESLEIEAVEDDDTGWTGWELRVGNLILTGRSPADCLEQAGCRVVYDSSKRVLPGRPTS